MLGCQPSTSEIGVTVKKSMQHKFDSDSSFQNLHFTVRSVSVVHSRDNAYEGLASISSRGKSHDVPVKITADGENIIWQTEPGSFVSFALENLDEKSFDPPDGQRQLLPQQQGSTEAFAPNSVAQELNGAPGAIVCPDFKTVGQLYEFYTKHWEDSTQDRLTGGQSTVIRTPSTPVPDPADYGCTLLEPGTLVEATTGAGILSGIPSVTARLGDGRFVHGVTLPSMLDKTRRSLDGAAETLSPPSTGAEEAQPDDPQKSSSVFIPALKSVATGRGFFPKGDTWIVAGDREGRKLLVQRATCDQLRDEGCEKLFIALDGRFLGTDTYAPSWGVHDVQQEGVGSFSAVYEDFSSANRNLPTTKVTYTWDGRRLRASNTPPTRPRP